MTAGARRADRQFDRQEAIDLTLFATPVARVGRFRSDVTHPKFLEAPATETYCFVFPRTAVWIEHEGRRPFIADANTSPVYNLGTAFRRRPVLAAVHRAEWCAVAPGVLREMVAVRDPRAADSDNLFRFTAVPANAGLFLAQRAVLAHLYALQVPDALFVEEKVIILLNSILDAAYSGASPNRSLTSRARDLAEAARAHLNATYRTSDGLGTLAARLDTSVYHLCRIFKQYTGLTIHQYRTQLRLRRALEILAHRDADLLEAALYLGFANHSHFTATFHRSFGLTPSQYRRGLPWPGKVSEERSGSRDRFAGRAPIVPDPAIHRHG